MIGADDIFEFNCKVVDHERKSHTICDMSCELRVRSERYGAVEDQGRQGVCSKELGRYQGKTPTHRCHRGYASRYET